MLGGASTWVVMGGELWKVIAVSCIRAMGMEMQTLEAFPLEP